jgi:antirestriction protein
LFYRLAIAAQPYAYQGWLEYSKLEEENGNLNESRYILLKSLKFNPFNENLFVKCLKLEEKQEDCKAS